MFLLQRLLWCIHGKDAHEYAGYIRELQQQTILLNDLEFFDLEELQGINGLKALLVSVNSSGQP